MVWFIDVNGDPLNEIVLAAPAISRELIGLREMPTLVNAVVGTDGVVVRAWGGGFNGNGANTAKTDSL